MSVRGVPGQLAAWCAAIGLAVVTGCGGGVGSGGTGMSAGVAQGTVNGFGSVIVDGDRFDDSEVAIFAETEPGVQTQTEARLGERVEVEVDASGGVRHMQVDAALVGAVEAVQLPDGFSMLGQTVAVNADATRGPVTQFAGGYTGLAAVQPGDAVEVHGFIVRSANGFSIQATRVERRTAVPRFLKLAGLAGNIDAGGFRLGNLRIDTTSAVLLPAGHVLADGERVSVLAAADSLVRAADAATLVRAAQVRVRELGEFGAEVALSGVIGLLDASGRRFDLGGTAVHYADALVQPEASALVDGHYVQVRGTLQADRSVRATAVRVRDGRNEAEAELKGNVDGLDLLGLRFSVRGVAVDAAAAEIEGCAETLADGQFVSVEGALGPTGVIAKSVQCEDEPGDATVEREGVAGTVDAAAGSFVLTPLSGTPIPVRWSDVTYFENITVATLDGQRVEVEGRWVDGVLVAKKVGVESDD